MSPVNDGSWSSCPVFIPQPVIFTNAGPDRHFWMGLVYTSNIDAAVLFTPVILAQVRGRINVVV